MKIFSHGWLNELFMLLLMFTATMQHYLVFISVCESRDENIKRLFAVQILIQHVLPVRMSDTLPRSVWYARYKQLCYGTDVISAEFASPHPVETHNQHETRAHIPVYSHARISINGEWVDGGINLNFRCHPWNSHISVRITFASQCTVVRRWETRNDERTLVKMCESAARCSLLPRSETSNARELAPIRYEH